MQLAIAAALTGRTRRVAPPASGGGSTALATLAASMSAGQWAQMSPTPSGLSLFTGQQGNSGLAIAYVTKLGRDPNNKKLYFIGCDHGDETLFLVYDEATNAWTEQAASVPWGVEAADTTSHGYDHTVYDDVHDKLYHRQYGARNIRRWDGGTTWGTLDLSGNLFYGAASAGVAWFPTMGTNGRIVVYQVENGTNGGIVSCDPVTSAVTTHVDGSSSTLAGTGDPHCFCLYSPQHDCVVFGGGNGSSNVWKMNASGTVTQLTDFPGAITNTVGPAGDTSVGNPNAIPFVNPANGNVTVIQTASNWVELNPTTNSWSTKGGTASIFSTNVVDSASAYGVACAPIPEYGVVAFVKNWSAGSAAQMWLWKAS